MDFHHFDSAKAGFVMSCTSFVATLKRVEQRPDATDATLKYVDAESEGSAFPLSNKKNGSTRLNFPNL